MTPAKLAVARDMYALGGQRLRRWLLIAVSAAGGALFLRGVLGLTLLVIDLLRGGLEEQTPPVLLAIEPWFVLGGLAYAGLAVHQRTRLPATTLSPGPIDLRHSDLRAPVLSVAR